MSRTPKLTRAARRIRDAEALALTTGKTIARALDARGLLPADIDDDTRWPWGAASAAAGVAHDSGGKITFEQALAAVDSALKGDRGAVRILAPAEAEQLFHSSDRGEWERFARALNEADPIQIQIGSPAYSLDPFKAFPEIRRYAGGGEVVAETSTVSVTREPAGAFWGSLEQNLGNAGTSVMPLIGRALYEGDAAAVLLITDQSPRGMFGEDELLQTPGGVAAAVEFAGVPRRVGRVRGLAPDSKDSAAAAAARVGLRFLLGDDVDAGTIEELTESFLERGSAPMVRELVGEEAAAGVAEEEGAPDDRDPAGGGSRLRIVTTGSADAAARQVEEFLDRRSGAGTVPGGRALIVIDGAAATAELEATLTAQLGRRLAASGTQVVVRDNVSGALRPMRSGASFELIPTRLKFFRSTADSAASSWLDQDSSSVVLYLSGRPAGGVAGDRCRVFDARSDEGLDGFAAALGSVRAEREAAGAPAGGHPALLVVVDAATPRPLRADVKDVMWWAMQEGKPLGVQVFLQGQEPDVLRWLPESGPGDAMGTPQQA